MNEHSSDRLARAALLMSHLIPPTRKINRLTAVAQMVMSNSMMKEGILYFPSPKLWLASFDERKMMSCQPWELWFVAKQERQAT